MRITDGSLPPHTCTRSHTHTHARFPSVLCTLKTSFKFLICIAVCILLLGCVSPSLPLSRYAAAFIHSLWASQVHTHQQFQDHFRHKISFHYSIDVILRRLTPSNYYYVLWTFRKRRAQPRSECVSRDSENRIRKMCIIYLYFVCVFFLWEFYRWYWLRWDNVEHTHTHTQTLSRPRNIWHENTIFLCSSIVQRSVVFSVLLLISFKWYFAFPSNNIFHSSVRSTVTLGGNNEMEFDYFCVERRHTADARSILLALETIATIFYSSNSRRIPVLFICLIIIVLELRLHLHSLWLV